MKLADLSPPGQKTILGTMIFTPEDIVRFATKYDPQPFHMDEEKAKNSVFGGLCASGWHTSAGWMQTMLKFWARETRRLESEGIAAPRLGPSPGFRKLQWLRPVFAGDAITYSVTLLSSRPLASRPGLIVNEMRSEGTNQNDQIVISFENSVLEYD